MTVSLCTVGRFLIRIPGLGQRNLRIRSTWLLLRQPATIKTEQSAQQEAKQNQDHPPRIDTAKESTNQLHTGRRDRVPRSRPTIQRGERGEGFEPQERSCHRTHCGISEANGGKGRGREGSEASLFEGKRTASYTNTALWT